MPRKSIRVIMDVPEDWPDAYIASLCSAAIMRVNEDPETGQDAVNVLRVKIGGVEYLVGGDDGPA